MIPEFRVAQGGRATRIVNPARNLVPMQPVNIIDHELGQVIHLFFVFALWAGCKFVDIGRTLASFFVVRGQTAMLIRIPDGIYTVQYAIGDKLTKNCRSFIKDGSESANVFPGQDTFMTRYEDDLDGTTVIHQHLTYTLYPVPGGSVHPNSLNMDEFDKP